MKYFDLYWSPEGKRIATVQARDEKSAKRKAPMPYRKFRGEIYTVERSAIGASQSVLIDARQAELYAAIKANRRKA